MKGKYAPLACAAALAVLAACAPAVPDLSGTPLPELERRAREEGRLYTVAMPDGWANWEEIWDRLETRCGIVQQDLDMSSAEELELFRSQKGSATKDMGDVGKSYAMQAEREDLLLRYRPGCWDEIPDWAKDSNGDWVVAYTGSVSFLVNRDRVDRTPESWQDLRESGCLVTTGDVSSSVQAQYGILASAYAFGGSVDDLEPGFRFWRELAAAGRLDQVYSRAERVSAGETEVAVLLDFNSLNYRAAALEAHPGMSFDAVIPRDGSLTLGYAPVISRYARHPYAAALAREYILSDEGQASLARGYARPVRRPALPADALNGLIPEEQYANVITVQDDAKIEKALKEIVRFWQAELLPSVRHG